MKHHRSLRKICSCLALAGSLTALLGAPGIAMAQNSAKSPAKLGTVQVTGSRIKRTDIETSQPVVRISHAEIEHTGLNNLGDVLQRLTSNGGGSNTATGVGTGQTTLDLRYLGSGRLLVLLNGKRFNKLGTGNSVDISTIPVGIVDHVEVLEDGASSTYGSDAIAGVVNIITIKNFNGAQANAYYGGYFGDGHYSGQTQHYSVTMGMTKDRGSVLFGAEYNNQTNILNKQRSYANVPIEGTGNTRGAPATPQGHFRFLAPPANSSNPSTAPAASTGLTSNQCSAVRNVGTGASPFYAPFCNLTLKAQAPGTSPSDFRPFRPSTASNTDLFNGTQFRDLLQPLNRISLFADGHYDITDHITFQANALYQKRVSTSDRTPERITIASFTEAQNIPANYRYNPFGFALNSTKPGAGLPVPNLRQINRLAVEEGPRAFDQHLTSIRFQGGLNGDFNALGANWDWDLDFIYGQTRNTGLAYRVSNFKRLQESLDPSVCSKILNCAPYNLFGGVPGLANPHSFNYPSDQPIPSLGSVSQSALNFVHLTHHHTIQSSGRVYDADISSSDIYDLPAGPLGLALGYQHREQDGFFSPAPDRLISRNPQLPTNGRFHVDAVYGELNIPLLADLPGVELLSVDASSRYSKYSSAGDTVNSRVGFKYQPIHDLLLRGSYSEGFRAPTIHDLFSGGYEGVSTFNDPCSNYPSKSAQIQQACRNAGVPANFQVNNSTPRPTLTGGNTDLKPESSVSKTVGLVYSPSFLPGASLNADYYKIRLKQEISTLGVQAIVNGCYLRGAQSFCNRIQRDAFGTVTFLDDTEINIGGLLTEGIDGGFQYHFPSTPYGDFNLNLRATYVKEFTSIVQTVNGTRQENDAGVFGRGTLHGGAIPEYKANAKLNWDYGNWHAYLAAHYLAGVNEVCRDGIQPSFVSLGLCSKPNGAGPHSVLHKIAPNAPVNHVGSVTYYDFQGRYTFPSINTTVTLGLNNIFGRRPPRSVTTFAFAQYFQLIGRFPYASVSVKF